jgi:hypothetical protein
MPPREPAGQPALPPTRWATLALARFEVAFIVAIEDHNDMIDDEIIGSYCRAACAAALHFEDASQQSGATR